MSSKTDKKKAVVPKLRFPEFRDAGPWERYKLGELLTLEYGGSLPEESRLDGSIPVVGSNGVVGFHSEALVSGPAIVVGRKGSVGEVNWIESDCYPIDTTFYVKLKCRNCLLIFIKLLLENANLISLSDNGAVPGLNRNDVYVLKTALPSEDEQQKIADCLSSLDEVIELEAKKLEALKAHKKGLMQQLFPREGETTPRLRFPEFRNAGPWEVKRLGEVADNLDNKRVPLTKKDRIKGDIPYYGASGIIDYVNDYLFDGDFLCVSEDGANLLDRVYPIAFSISGKSWVNNHVHVLKFDRQYTQILVENYLNYTNIEDYLTGMAQPKLNRAKLDSIPIPLPAKPEQQKIADCLSSLDEVIELEAKKLEALKAHKKGLMQQLFPQEGEQQL